MSKNPQQAFTALRNLKARLRTIANNLTKDKVETTKTSLKTLLSDWDRAEKAKYGIAGAGESDEEQTEFQKQIDSFNERY